MMKLKIVSPEGLIYEGATVQVSFPGIAGAFDVLPQHAPLVAALRDGEIRYGTGEEERVLNIQSGFVEVKEDVLSVCIKTKKDE